MAITINRERCLGCGCCMDGCFHGTLEFEDDVRMDYRRIVADQEVCIACGECVALCPSEALEIDG